MITSLAEGNARSVTQGSAEGAKNRQRGFPSYDGHSLRARQRGHRRSSHKFAFYASFTVNLIKVLFQSEMQFLLKY
jgi:hypothetical protein